MQSTTTLDAWDEAGIAALVRAGESKNWFFGHFGAALIAGTRLLRDPELPGPAAMALSAKLSDLVAENRDWFAPLSNAALSTPFELASVGAHRNREALVVVLRRDAGTLRTSGHATIYLSAALDVLARHPGWSSDRVVDGLISLHAAGQEDDPARYYGTPDYFDGETRAISSDEGRGGDSIEAFRIGIASLDHQLPDREIEGRRHFLTGEKLHLLTHAHAIATFERLGLGDVAERAMRAQERLAGLVEPSRGLEAAEVAAAGATPFDAHFWEQSVPDVFHVIKVAEAVVAQVPRLPEGERGVALERIARLWTLLGIR